METLGEKSWKNRLKEKTIDELILDNAEERISELEKNQWKVSKPEKRQKKKILKHDQNICEMQDPYQVV